MKTVFAAAMFVAMSFLGANAQEITRNANSFDVPADGNYIRICVDPVPYIVCEKGIQVAIDLVNNQVDKVEHAMGFSIDSPYGYLRIEGEEGDTVTLYEVEAETTEDAYRVFYGPGGTVVKVSKKMHVQYGRLIEE